MFIFYLAFEVLYKCIPGVPSVRNFDRGTGHISYAVAMHVLFSLI